MPVPRTWCHPHFAWRDAGLPGGVAPGQEQGRCMTGRGCCGRVLGTTGTPSRPNVPKWLSPTKQENLSPEISNDWPQTAAPQE